MSIQATEPTSSPGFTGHDGPPVKALHHVAAAAHPSPSKIRREMREVDGVNAKVAVLITRLVGSMWCAYVFGLIALLGLRPALKPGGEGIIAWIAQTFLQLVLLSVIMVGQAVQSAASDARSVQTYRDAEAILRALDAHTQGGLGDIMAELKAMEARLPTESGHPVNPASEVIPQGVTDR